MIKPVSRQLRAGVVLLVAAGVALSGCTLPDVSMSPGLGDASASTTAPPPSPEPEAPATVPVVAPAPTRPAGDLDTGSTTRTVPAGERTLVVDWWTTEQATQWRAADTKGVQLSAHLEGGDADLEVLVTRFVAPADDRTARTTVAEDRGEFALQPPYGYGTALVLTPSAAWGPPNSAGTRELMSGTWAVPLASSWTRSVARRMPCRTTWLTGSPPG